MESVKTGHLPAVPEPTPGIFDAVVVADYKSMYPTMMLNSTLPTHRASRY